MRILFSITIISIFPILLYSQNRELHGKVLFQNSGKKPAVNVKVMGQGANPDYSTTSGDFVLKFSHKLPGDIAGISIGAFDRDNMPIEMVNSEIISKVKIPNDLSDTTFIIVCKAGQLAEAKNHFYKIGETKLTLQYEKLKKEKQNLIAKSNLTEQQKLKLEIQIDSLDSRYKKALQKIDELAGFISTINSDFASALVKDALKRIEVDQDIEGALEILSNSKLDQAYNAASNKKKEAEYEINKVIEAYELKAQILSTSFKFTDIAECYNRIIHIAEENNFHSSSVAYYLEKLSNAYLSKGEFKNTISCIKKALTLQKTLLKSDDPTLAKYYWLMSTPYLQIGDYDSTVAYLDSAIKLAGKFMELRLSIGVKVLQNFGEVFNLLESYSDAIEQFKNAESILIDSGIVNNSLAKIYTGMGLSWQKLNYLDSALKYQIDGINIYHKFLNNRNPELVNAFCNIAETYRRLGNLEKAILYNDSSLAIALAALDSHHPNIAADYFIKAKILFDQNQFKSALDYYDRSLEIYRSYSPNYYEEKRLIEKSKMRYFHDLGSELLNKKKYQEALQVYDTLTEYDFNSSVGLRKGLCYYYLGNYNKAIEQYESLLLDTIENVKTSAWNNIGLAYAKNKQFQYAKKAFEWYQSNNANEGRAYRNWALYFGLLKDKEQCIYFLQKSIEKGYNDINWITTDESLEIIRYDPRYKQMVEKLKTK